MTAPPFIQRGPVTITFDDRIAQRLLGDAVKELPFTLALALNKTGDAIHAAMREQYPKRFHARNPKLLQWLAPVYLGAAVKARKDKLWIVLDTGAASVLLDPFETGKPHSIDRMGRMVAVPTTPGKGGPGLRATPMTVIPRALYPVNLGLAIRRDPKQGSYYYALGRGSILKKLTPFKTTMSGKVQIQGQRGTYQIQTPKGPIIFQHVPGLKKSLALWFLTPGVPRPVHLEFVGLGTRVANAVWENNLNNSALWALLHPHK